MEKFCKFLKNTIKAIIISVIIVAVLYIGGICLLAKLAVNMVEEVTTTGYSLEYSDEDGGPVLYTTYQVDYYYVNPNSNEKKLIKTETTKEKTLTKDNVFQDDYES